jgi:hypothetical protein
MGFSGRTAANAFAWAVIIGLIAVAFVMVLVVGPFGLVLLGLFTMFVCTSFKLRDDAPTWGPEVFKARMNDDSSPEERAARREEKRGDLSSVRFFNRCGIVLTVAGVLGFAWEQFR